MSSQLQPRFENGRAMLLAGLRRTHTFAESAEGIPAQWTEWMKKVPVPNQVGTTQYGVMAGADEEQKTMEYMCAVEVSTFDGLPNDLGRMRLEPRKYAIFTHDGHISKIRETWDYVWKTWLPQSGVKAVHAPDFEAYDSRFDPTTGMGQVELWVPVHVQ